MSETSDATRIDATDAEDADLLINDPDDYHETQRIREIHTARREVHKTLREIDRFTTTEEHERQKTALADVVSAYVIELEPLMHATGYNGELSGLPWNTVGHYAALLGAHPDDREISPYEHSMAVFRTANKFLSEVKPLVTEKETTEWEV